MQDLQKEKIELEAMLYDTEYSDGFIIQRLVELDKKLGITKPVLQDNLYDKYKNEIRLDLLERLKFSASGISKVYIIDHWDTHSPKLSIREKIYVYGIWRTLCQILRTMKR